MKNKIGSPKIDSILATKKERETFLKKLRRKQGVINWAIIIIFFIGLSVTVLVSVGPFFSVRYKLAESSFDSVLEEKIIKDYYKLPEIEDRYLPFADFDEKIFDSSGIEETIKEELAPLTGSYGVYVKNLGSGEEFGLNQEKVFTAASLSKLFVTGTYYNMLQNDLNLKNKTVKLEDNDRVGGAGDLAGEMAGSTYYPGILVEKMLKQSDNTAFAMMTRFLGFKKINSFIKDSKFENTSFKNNTTTPKDAGDFLEKLYRYELFDQYYSDEMVRLMTNTLYEDRIPYYLPDDATVAHKIGSWTGAYSDAGIVYTDLSDYIIVVMTDNADYTQAVNAIRKVSQVVYEYFD